MFFKNNFHSLFLGAFLCLSVGLNAQDSRERNYQYEVLDPRHEIKPKVQGFASERITEKLNRGLCAASLVNKQAVYLSWRLLLTDQPGVAFHVYRQANGKEQCLTTQPIVNTCDFIDTNPVKGLAQYWIQTVGPTQSSVNQTDKVEVSYPALSNFTSIKLHNGEKVGKIAVADLNGDGSYDYIVRTPETNTDPGMPADTTGKTFSISAYLSDGTYLWTYNMGSGVEPGIWFSPFVAYDFNGDGKAEIAIKGVGTNFFRDAKGHVAGGDEFLIVLDGMTGKIIDQVSWPERNFRYGDVNRQNRNQTGMAFLDGKTPCILAARGTYRLMVVDAWQLHNNKLEKLWRWDGDEENPIIRSQGAHNMVSGDVDNDGCDEVLLGSCMLDDNGTALWSTGLGHSDKAYMTQMSPNSNGMQVFLVSEPWQTDGRGVLMVDAKTGKQRWKIGQSTFHVGDGMVTDFDPSSPGLECFASEDSKGGSSDKYLLTAAGKKINTANNQVPGCRNWLWWDADKLRETIHGSSNEWGASSESNGRKQQIVKYKGKSLTDNIEGDILMMADITGDWREELITALPGEIRIYRTNIPASDRRVTLMQDAVYRSYVLQRSQGYPQSPVPSYYLGE